MNLDTGASQKLETLAQQVDFVVEHDVLVLARLHAQGAREGMYVLVFRKVELTGLFEPQENSRKVGDRGRS